MSDYIRDLRQKVGSRVLIMPSVTALIRDSAGRFLLVKHADTGRWVAPGGAVEIGERPADAVAREVWEETGLSVRPTAIIGVFGGPDFLVTYSNGDQTAYVMTVFACDVVGGALRSETDETTGAQFVSPEDVDTLDVSPWIRRLLPVLGSRKASISFEPATWHPPV